MARPFMYGKSQYVFSGPCGGVVGGQRAAEVFAECWESDAEGMNRVREAAHRPLCQINCSTRRLLVRSPRPVRRGLADSHTSLRLTGKAVQMGADGPFSAAR